MVITDQNDPTEDNTANDHSTDATHEHHAKESGTASTHSTHKAADSHQQLPTANQFKEATSSNPGLQQAQDLGEAESDDNLKTRAAKLNEHIENSK